MPVYTIFANTGEEYRQGTKPLDGDTKKVYPVGFEFDPNSNDPSAAGNLIRQPDRTYVQKISTYQGVPVDLTHLPTKVEIGGPKRILTDLLRSNSIFMVSDRFRSVIEGLEPGRHQFAPVELVWADGSHAADFFWFYPCARVDGMDREKTTHELHREREWKRVAGGEYVVSLNQVGAHHVWVEARLTSGSVFVSEIFRRAASRAGVTGVGYNEFSAV